MAKKSPATSQQPMTFQLFGEFGFPGYPLVMTNIAMENHHAIVGKSKAIITIFDISNG